MFSCGFWEISKNIFSYRTPPVAASVSFHYIFRLDVIIKDLIDFVYQSDFLWSSNFLGKGKKVYRRNLVARNSHKNRPNASRDSRVIQKWITLYWLLYGSPPNFCWNLNAFKWTDSFLFLLKTSLNLKFPNIFRENRSELI